MVIEIVSKPNTLIIRPTETAISIGEKITIINLDNIKGVITEGKPNQIMIEGESF